MAAGSIILVHGTGVRLRRYEVLFNLAQEAGARAGIRGQFIRCAWGDPLGVQFEGKSIPGPPSEGQLREEADDFAQWKWLFDDPLLELDTLTVRNTGQHIAPSDPRAKPDWLQLWEKIESYRPTEEVAILLARGSVGDCWDQAWTSVITAPVAKEAFEASVGELADAARALARALIAELNNVAQRASRPGPNRLLRVSLADQLVSDWGMKVFGLGSFLRGRLSRAATSVLRSHRAEYSDLVALAVGDILLYLAHGAEIRSFVRSKIEGARPPVVLLTHSLGGIACVDLLCSRNPPEVAALVTIGSQASMLYELGALPSLKPNHTLPDSFPRWLNVFDRNDFLSYVANPIFPQAEDFEASSGMPFPQSHSAYFSNELVWNAISELA